MGDHAKKALVIEDDETLARLLDVMLGRLGFSVRIAENGGAGLTAIDEHGGDLDLIILDYSLPDRGCPEMIEQCRLRAPGSKLLLTSGYTADMLDGVDPSRIDGFLKKPFDFDEVCDTLMEVMTASPALRFGLERRH